MSTFPDTRYLLLDHASMLASTDGLAGLSAARVARAARLSKATVHGHLGGRERLHLSVLDHAVWELVRDVVIPARRAPHGVRRLEALLRNWMAWNSDGYHPGGCPLVAIATEFDDRPGPVRERLLRWCAAWRRCLAREVAQARLAGELREPSDPDQFVHDYQGIMLGYHLAERLVRDLDAQARALRAFDSLVGREEDRPGPSQAPVR